MAKWISTLLAVMLTVAYSSAEPLKALIVDGQNNHAWKETTPILKQLLEQTGKFTVDIATSPAKGGDMSTFKPNFKVYAVVVSNYNGEPWSSETQEAFEKFVREGGGFVSFHAADNAFPQWKQYQEMIGVGGWGGRKTGDFGSKIRWKDGKATQDSKPGICGHHGERLSFQVTMRDKKHPIAKGLPEVWLHAGDELYDSLCGPAKDVTVIGTAHSDPNNKGTDEDEPVLMALRYGKGRVFHTTLGHDIAAMRCVGFVATLQRGSEWAATGKVTQNVPKDFPSAAQTRIRD